MIGLDILSIAPQTFDGSDGNAVPLRGITAHLLSALAASGVLVAIYDQNDRLRYGNPKFRDAYHVPPTAMPTWEEMIRSNFASGRGAAFNTTDIDAWIVAAMARRCKSPSRQFECDLLDGRWLLVDETTSVDGWTLFVASDVTNLHASDRSLRLARDNALISSQTDPLTGVANRRRIMAQLQCAIERVDETDTCVCLLDIDHFKSVNDRLGHLTGDAVLVAFTRTVQCAIRARDCLGRVGGEEFILILSGTRADTAASRLRDVIGAVRGMVVADTPPDFHVTCSAGLTQIRAGDTIAEVFQRFDAALYDAKRAGRDQFKVAVAP